MKYITKTVEKKTTQTGKEYAVVTLQDETGAVYEKVSVWSDHPQFGTLLVGYSVDGEIKTNDKGYKNLYAPRASTSPFKGGMGSNLMQTKADNIEHAQKAKEASILIASTFSSATQILTALMENKRRNNMNLKDSYPQVEEDWQGKWVEIRHWLVKNYSNTEQKKVGEMDYPRNDFPEGTPF